MAYSSVFHQNPESQTLVTYSPVPASGPLTIRLKALEVVWAKSAGGVNTVFYFVGSQGFTITVSETAAAISAELGTLIPLTPIDSSGTVYVNAGYLEPVPAALGSGSKVWVKYAQMPIIYEVAESPAAIEVLVDNLTVIAGEFVTTNTQQSYDANKSLSGLTQWVPESIPAAGVDQAGATQIDKHITNITIAGSGGVRLPIGANTATANASSHHRILNSDTSSINIYPATGQAIDALGANNPYVLLPGHNALFVWIVGVWRRVSEISNAGNELIVYADSFTEKVTTTITAFATGGQAGAFPLTYGYSEITICATAGDSVKLPDVVAGTSVTVKNNGAASADVFPFLGDSINALGVNLAMPLPAGASRTFTKIDGIVWESSEQIISSGSDYTFDIQPDMYIRSVSATQWGVFVGGTLRAVIDTAGVKADEISTLTSGGNMIVTTQSDPGAGTNAGMLNANPGTPTVNTGAGAGGAGGDAGYTGGTGGGTETGTGGAGGAGNFFGGKGGPTTGIGGTGGDGANATLKGGAGGPDLDGTAGTGGDGGDAIIKGGAGGAGNTPGTDGVIRIQDAGGNDMAIVDETGIHANTPIVEVTTVGANAIAVPFGNTVYDIAALGVSAMTLVNPTTGTHDGLEITFMATTANAHTLSNAGGAGFNGGGAGADLATFGGAVGDSIKLVALKGVWYISNSINIALS